MLCEHIPRSIKRIIANESRILFAREFPIIDSAESADKLKLRLKSEELEQYGPSFTPKDVYEAIKRIPRFADMKVSLKFTHTSSRIG